LHSEINGSVTLDNDTVTNLGLGLVVGNIYEIALFHAERHTNASNFNLTLNGFTSTRTSCETECGNGIITPDEACDDVDNDGGYNECDFGCTLGLYCGDGVLTEGPEACDFGKAVNVGTYGDEGLCTPTCEDAPYCGDGMIQEEWGEECDDPGNTGLYGQDVCTVTCRQAPYCGDGVKQTDEEECDLGAGNNTGGYGGCTDQCEYGPYCGDNARNGPEECDDGNRVDLDGCSAGCMREFVIE
jgi:cysteine-rich repeat protein